MDVMIFVYYVPEFRKLQWILSDPLLLWAPVAIATEYCEVEQ